MECGHSSYPDTDATCKICAITSDLIKPISQIYLANWGILCKCKLGHVFVYFDTPGCPTCKLIGKYNMVWVGGVYMNELSMLHFICGNQRKNNWYKNNSNEPMFMTCNMRIIVNAVHITDKSALNCDHNHKWSAEYCAPIMALTVIESYFSACFNDFYSFKTHVTGYNQILNMVIIHTDQVADIKGIEDECENCDITIIVVKGTYRHAIINEIACALYRAGMLHSGHDIKTAKNYIKKHKNDMQTYTNRPKCLPDQIVSALV